MAHLTIDELREKVAELDAKHDGVPMPAEARAEWNTLNAQIDEFQARRDRITELATTHPERQEAGFNVRPTSSTAGRTQSRSVIERIHRDGHMTDQGAERMDTFLRAADPIDDEYITAAGNPDYATAFGKLLADPAQGHLRFTTAEQTAMMATNQVLAQRGMVGGTGSAGGFALPIEIDPTVMLTNNGQINPVRGLARVITVGSREWRGLTSAGVSASYDPEASEVSDDTPTLGQPTITTASGRAFVPFSIELGQDWAGITDELARIIRDGRDVLDATKFLTGTGTDEPAGILTGLTTSQRVQTATTATYAVGDPWALKAAIPPRFTPNASVIAAPATLDATYRFVGGSSVEPPVMPDRAGNALGLPTREWSTMNSATTTGSKLMIAGDIHAGYTIIDRVGMTVELVPHLFGANRRPTGERGFFAMWRTGAKVVVPEALRYLEVK